MKLGTFGALIMRAFNPMLPAEECTRIAHEQIIDSAIDTPFDELVEVPSIAGGAETAYARPYAQNTAPAARYTTQPTKTQPAANTGGYQRRAQGHTKLGGPLLRLSPSLRNELQVAFKHGQLRQVADQAGVKYVSLHNLIKKRDQKNIRTELLLRVAQGMGWSEHKVKMYLTQNKDAVQRKRRSKRNAVPDGHPLKNTAALQDKR